MAVDKRYLDTRKFLSIAAACVVIIAIVLALQPTRETNELRQLTYWLININKWNRNGNLSSVESVFDRLGYRKVNGSEEFYDVMWSVEFPYDQFPDKLVDLQPHQQINHIPAITFLTNKFHLATTTISKYIPVSFQFPRQKNEYFYYSSLNPDKRFVVRYSSGRGARIVNRHEIDFHLGEAG